MFLRNHAKECGIYQRSFPCCCGRGTLNNPFKFFFATDSCSFLKSQIVFHVVVVRGTLNNPLKLFFVPTHVFSWKAKLFFTWLEGGFYIRFEWKLHGLPHLTGFYSFQIKGKQPVLYLMSIWFCRFTHMTVFN
jgi:hypothetical protein